MTQILNVTSKTHQNYLLLKVFMKGMAQNIDIQNQSPSSSLNYSSSSASSLFLSVPALIMGSQILNKNKITLRVLFVFRHILLFQRLDYYLGSFVHF
jgi:hypothetical protein